MRACENVAEFQQALLASGIVSEQQLVAFLKTHPAATQTSDISKLAKRLVKAELLTEYQAQAIYAGRGASLTLGNYVLLDKLGQGGMGTVLKARQTKMGRIVALKLLSRDVMKLPDAVLRFQQEAHAAAKLSHANIVIAFDADEAHGTHFLAMEFVDGTDLSAIIKQHGPRPLTVAVDWVKQAATGLAYAHARGVIHRDIKPANLLLSQDGTIKVLDLGLARIVREVGDSSDPREADSPVTKSGQIMGTIDFMAPEQARGTPTRDPTSTVSAARCFDCGICGR